MNDLLNQEQDKLRDRAIAELLEALTSLTNTPQVTAVTRAELQERLGLRKDQVLELLRILDAQGRIESILVNRPILGGLRYAPRIGYRLKGTETK